MNERQLLKKAKRLDENALAEIYDRYSAGLFRYAMRLLNNRDAAEECVAETFSRMLQALHQGGGPDTYLRAYLYRTAHNWIMDLFRQRPTADLESQFGTNGLVQEADLAQRIDTEREAIRVRAALLHLTADQRQVVMLKFYEGWRNQEIAAALDKPLGAVKALQHRALAALERQLTAIATEEISE